MRRRSIPANGNLVTGTGNNPSVNGIIIGGQNSQFGSAVQASNYKNFAPRLGSPGIRSATARRPFARAMESITIRLLFGTYEQNIFTNPPYVQSVNYSNSRYRTRPEEP